MSSEKRDIPTGVCSDQFLELSFFSIYQLSAFTFISRRKSSRFVEHRTVIKAGVRKKTCH